MKYRNVLCVYPYRKELKSVGFFPPLGLEYIASAIENRVEKIDVIDLRYEKELLSSFITDKTDLVLVSYNWDTESEFVKSVINSIPKNITVIVGGRHATKYVEELFMAIPRINGIVRGDGEEIIRELVQKGPARDIDGLSFRLNGTVVHNKNKSIDSVQSDFFPDRKRRRYKYMVTLDEFNTGIEIDLMSGSRGCPFNCKFCDFSFNPLGEKRRWSSRTPESVVEEIKTINARVVGFADDLFTTDPRWVEKVCDLIIKERIKKKFIINTRLPIAKHPDLLHKMYRAGFMVFLLGIESTQDRTLKSMQKGFTVEDIKKYFEVLRKFNFIYHCYYIIGNIGETREEMIEIPKLSRELGVDTLGLSLLRVTKFSPLIDMVNGLDNYHIEDNSGKVYSDELSVEDLQQIRRDVNASFFTIPIILKLLRKLIIHRILTLGILYELIIYTARRKIRKLAEKRSIRMGRVYK